MIVSGTGILNEPANTEVIDLAIENSTCTKFANHPFNASAGVGEILGQNAVFCGGEYLDRSKNSYSYFGPKTVIDECYIINQSSAKYFAKMQEKRSQAASRSYNNKIWITGGQNYKVVSFYVLLVFPRN